MIKTLFLAFVYIVIGTFLLSLWGFYWAIKPMRIYSDITPQHLKLPYEKITLQTEDNITIRGWFIPNVNPKAKAIVLLHGYPADKGNILPGLAFLHKQYHLLLIDFRYLGESGGTYSSLGKYEVLDVMAALQYLEKRGIKAIGIWGFSLGGAVALMAAEKSTLVKAVVADSSYSSLDQMALEYYKIPLLHYPLGWLMHLWGWLFLKIDITTVSPIQSAIKLKIPLLIIHSKADKVISFEHALLFKKQLDRRPNVQFIFQEDLSHGESPVDYQNTITDFFAKNL